MGAITRTIKTLDVQIGILKDIMEGLTETGDTHAANELMNVISYLRATSIELHRIGREVY